ncbi:hypothetical protein [Pandoraea commovens]|nr:hypothetical protein [Pandoraea commovens]
MDINEIRLTNLRGLADRAGGRPALAARMEMSYQLLQNYIGKTPIKRIGDKTARRAEDVFGLPHGWMDMRHDEAKIVSAKGVNWPFTIERARFDRLPDSEKARVARFVRDTVEAWEQEHAPETREAS